MPSVAPAITVVPGSLSMLAITIRTIADILPCSQFCFFCISPHLTAVYQLAHTTMQVANSLLPLRTCRLCAIRNRTPIGRRRSYATPVAGAGPSSSSSSSSSTRSTGSSSSSSTGSTSSGSTGIPNTSAYAVFDRSTKIKQKNRAVRRDVQHSRLTDYVKDEIAANLVERLLVRARHKDRRLINIALPSVPEKPIRAHSFFSLFCRISKSVTLS